MIPEFLHQTGFNGLVAVAGVVAVGCVAAVVAHFIFMAAIKTSGRISERALGARVLSARLLSAARRPVMMFFVVLGVFMAYLLMTRLTHPAFDFANGHERWTSGFGRSPQLFRPAILGRASSKSFCSGISRTWPSEQAATWTTS